MPRAHPEEFRRDVVALARRHEMPMSQIAKDFGISESCLFRWVKQAEIDAGRRDGLTSEERRRLVSLATKMGPPSCQKLGTTWAPRSDGCGTA